MILEDKWWFEFLVSPFKFEIVNEKNDMVVEILRALGDW